VLGPYLRVIDQWFTEDRARPRKQRHTAKRIYDRLVREFGFQGHDSTVRRYVRKAKRRLGVQVTPAFIPLEPECGREAEVDWGAATAIIAGEKMPIKFFCMRSKFSGKHFVRCYPCERQQAFLDGHLHAFAFFGGIHPILVYDNLTAAVKQVCRGKGRIEQEEFAKFRAYYNFTPRFCNPDGAHEKGGVEGLVGYVRRNYLVPVPEAESREALNDRLLEECLAYGEHRIRGREGTVNELFAGEQDHLLPLPAAPFSLTQITSGKVDAYATVIVDKHRYSVPSVYAGLRVQVQLSVTHWRSSTTARSWPGIFGSSVTTSGSWTRTTTWS
jgi:transposase